MKLKIFGRLTDLFKGNEYDISYENITSVSGLKIRLEEKFPALKGTTYLVVINGIKAEETKLISEDAEIALLPPYSGG